jgi:formate hydrogenlyase subunit 3/multisubunit Na+/H+ antiporter MnhD subunit
MGMWPFGQIWLPDAHPAAPSPVSAMLSGVMIKTGVYGVMRYFIWLVPLRAQADYPLAAWGFVIAVLGTITLFTGTMQALKQEQSKRLLAFHSIGQVGYILLGVGTCMALLPVAGSTAAMLPSIAFFGALLHVLNHGLFKALLFLNAGSMLHATGTQDLNKLGGLMKYMPLTAITALVASFSISGVPLFNGFVSKWSIFVASIQGSRSAHYLSVCAIVAILTSALTLASFIKFFGVSFLSRTSALVAARAAASVEAQDGAPGSRPRFSGANLGRALLEVPWTMQLPQLFLALLCIGIGLFPAVPFRLMQRALETSREGFGNALAAGAPVFGSTLTGLTDRYSISVFTPLALAAVLVLLFVLVRGMSKLGGAARRTAAPWLCGYAQEAECHRYVAHNFYGEVKRYFGWLGGSPH